MEAAIGVIGLSLQLIDSAVKVKRAIGNYRSASTEINRLALKVERVEAICGAIKKSLEGEPSTRQCSDLIGTWGVCVLRSVQSTLAELHDIIAKLEKKAAKKRILNAAGMAFLEKKDDITRLKGQASFTCSGSYANASGGPSVTEKVTTSNQRDFNAFGFRGQSQSVRVLRKSRWLNDSEIATAKEIKTYTFGLSGISYRVEFHWQLSMASPVVYAMNIRHIISKDTDLEIVQDIQNAMCGGDLQALQRMISAKRLTLGSLFGDRTLFEVKSTMTG
ncbi:hypothetical protein ColLi_13825 [Colletotrichum liriopes]|uniref:Fungal N-terminal domain-containing protein n=1 Tax=Colletotrichum liriopes TaxID=708192 RepID=A0AA37LZW7_9PEZI|nr:hypothetical protein ColLi_13825 [Colletotrichum liriopes]